MFKWRLALMVINSDSAFNGGYFKVSQNGGVQKTTTNAPEAAGLL